MKYVVQSTRKNAQTLLSAGRPICYYTIWELLVCIFLKYVPFYSTLWLHKRRFESSFEWANEMSEARCFRIGFFCLQCVWNNEWMIKNFPWYEQLQLGQEKSIIWVNYSLRKVLTGQNFLEFSRRLLTRFYFWIHVICWEIFDQLRSCHFQSKFHFKREN